MELIDYIARRWEIKQRGAESAPARLSPREWEDFLVASFDVIAKTLDTTLVLPRATVGDQLANWAKIEWELAPGRARSAAAAALDFWDEAGVYVARDDPPEVRARQVNLHEIGLARWLARRASDDEREQWLRANVDDPAQEEILVLLAALHEDTATVLIERAAEHGDRRLGLLMVRAIAAGPTREDTESTSDPLIDQVVEALRPHLQTDDSDKWEALHAILPLALQAAHVETILEWLLEGADDQRSVIVRQLAELHWKRVASFDPAAVAETVKAGPPRGARDSLFADLVIVAARRATPEMPALVTALAQEMRIHVGAWRRMDKILNRRGCAQIVAEARRGMPSEEQLGRKMLDEIRVGKLRELELIASLAEGSASYAQRRHLSELCQFKTTTVPDHMPVVAYRVVLFKSPRIAKRAFLLVARLGGFDPSVLAGQAHQISQEEQDEAWRCALYYAAEVRALDQWPSDGSGVRAVLDELMALLPGTQWTADIVGRALPHCPLPHVAIERMEVKLPAAEDPSVKSILSRTLLKLDPQPIERCQGWLDGDDLVLARVAALDLAQFYLADQTTVDVLRSPLLEADMVTREEVRRALAERHGTSPELDDLLERSAALPPERWSCLYCQASNHTSDTACAKCRRGRSPM